MTAVAEGAKRYIRGSRPLRIVSEDPKKFEFPTTQAAYDALKALGLSDHVIFDVEIQRIQPKVDYSMGGGPITAYEFSGMAHERVRRLVPLAELNAEQRDFILNHGYAQVAELKRFDKPRRVVWVPVRTRPVIPDSPIG